MREAGERAQAKGATQSTLWGAGRGWVGRGWLWEMAGALVRGRRQQALGAADSGPREWGRGQAPIPATSATPHIGPAPRPQHPRSLPLPVLPSPLSPGKMPPKFGKLDGCQLTVLEGKQRLPGGGGLLPRPRSHGAVPPGYSEEGALSGVVGAHGVTSKVWGGFSGACPSLIWQHPKAGIALTLFWLWPEWSSWNRHDNVVNLHVCAAGARSDLKIPSFSTPGPLEPARQLTGPFFQLSLVLWCHSLFPAWGGGVEESRSLLG